MAHKKAGGSTRNGREVQVEGLVLKIWWRVSYTWKYHS